MLKQQSNNTNPTRSRAWYQIIRLGEFSISDSSLKLHCQNIVDTAENIFASKVSLWLNKDRFPTPNIVIASVYDIDDSVECSPLMRKAIEKRITLSTSDTHPITEIPSYSLTAPIYNNHDLLGVITIERSPNQFTRNEKKLFDGLVLQIGITLTTIRKHALEQWSIQLLELVRKVGQQISEVYEISEFTKRVTQLIFDQFHYYYVAIYSVDIEKQILQFQQCAGPYVDTNKSNALPNTLTRNINFGEGIIGQAASTNRELLVQNVDADTHYRFDDGLPWTKSEFAIPLIYNNNLYGILDIQSEDNNAFTELDILVLRALSDHIAIAISNVSLYNDVNQRADQLSIVAEISKAISSILDFNHLLNNIVSLIHIRFSIPRVNLFTVHPGRNKICYRAGAGQLVDSFALPSEGITFDFDDQQGLVPWAVKHRESVTINDVSNDSRFRVSLASSDTVKSQMVIPLIYGDQVLGVLDLQSPQSSAFNQGDIFLFSMLADSISIAIRNANLYSSEQWRRQVSDSLKEVAGLLSANIELSNVLKLILQELNNSLPSDVSAIWLVDSYETEIIPAEATYPLKLAAIYPDNEILHELLLMEEMPGTPCPWMDEAINSPTPLIRSTSSPYEPIGAYLNYPPDYSAIGAPLQTNDQTLGLLVLINKNSGKYGSESQGMTATFASYSSVAINNTRLYEAAHDQAWVATVLLQVAEATQSLTSTLEILETVVRIVPRLIGLKSCALFLWDEVTETFLPASSYGLDLHQEEEFQTWHIPPGDVTAFDHLLKEKSPILVDRSSLPNKNNFLSFNSLDIDNELWGLFPMVAQNNIRGAILINFTTVESSRTNSHELFEEKFVIIQGIANQTAVGLENIMLLQSQEEEAYTSVALLQVAQAIVSLSNIDEILGAIVRITPILVGVKRCVVYLVDSSRREFQLSQVYGISKQELIALPTKYLFEEYAFLSAIHSSSNTVVRLLPEGDESPTIWDKYTENDFSIMSTRVVNAIDIPTTSTSDDYLKYKGRILFGFPLDIKGNVLGLMVIEEGNNPKGAPSARIRQRRLEIITGITQQAALAIHNDLLQKEAVIREKLEREMQLAREIQVTFLPKEFPRIEEWDLDIHWRPARQVSGDFYDLIPYPDGRIGLVMADVADKGMPAALFMILVRTLIRAAVKDNLSPADVLMQVNDLLVPDSEHGMFVTVLLAILTPDDGTLIYANAGHNPPIIHRTDNSLQELLPTGMALGILESIEIKEEKITINSGDRVIFYTDGVSEAFSIQDEMFGVERLRQTILSSRDKTAKDLLGTIENTLSEFLRGAAQSDDLTIAALIRE